MSTHNSDSPRPKDLATLVANGEVRPGNGSHFLPKPLKTAIRAKTAADYVAEGRR